MGKTAAPNSAIMAVSTPAADLTEAQIFAILPNPVFVLDRDDRFIYLNQAAEIFFQSSQMMLLETSLASLIPADSNFLSMVSRARAQVTSVGDQGVEFAGPKSWFQTDQCTNHPIW
jgi:two-component system nitrogen regulation sensor histidine kinase GlnL